LVIRSKNGYLFTDRGEKPFFSFFHSHSPAPEKSGQVMLLQKPKKLTKKELGLLQAPNPKHPVIVFNGIYMFKKNYIQKGRGRRQRTKKLLFLLHN
jgi:hypothetical protein